MNSNCTNSKTDIVQFLMVDFSKSIYLSLSVMEINSHCQKVSLHTSKHTASRDMYMTELQGDMTPKKT